MSVLKEYNKYIETLRLKNGQPKRESAEGHAEKSTVIKDEKVKEEFQEKTKKLIDALNKGNYPKKEEKKSGNKYKVFYEVTGKESYVLVEVNLSNPKKGVRVDSVRMHYSTSNGGVGYDEHTYHKDFLKLYIKGNLLRRNKYFKTGKL